MFQSVRKGKVTAKKPKENLMCEFEAGVDEPNKVVVRNPLSSVVRKEIKKMIEPRSGTHTREFVK
jgi:hypothetical protein